MRDSSMLILMGAVFLFGVSGYLVLRWWLAAPGRAVEHWIRQIEAGENPDFSAKQNFDTDLVLTPDGFEIVPLKRRKNQAVRVDWQRVLEVQGYKRDLITTDLVCIAFVLENDTTVEIDEEMRGFTALCEELPAALPGVLPSERWYQDIAFGPAETKMARLFVRAPGSLSA